jgi:hypothetical protein
MSRIYADQEEKEFIKRVFDYCPLIKRNCSHAGYYKKELHCGLKTGNLNETKIRNIIICPKKLKKSTKKTQR